MVQEQLIPLQDDDNFWAMSGFETDKASERVASAQW